MRLAPLIILLSVGAANAANELAQVKQQLHAAEVQNKQIESEVKKSDASVEKTQKQLVSAAAVLQQVETQRGEISDKIQSLDSRRDRLQREIAANKDNLARTAAVLAAISSRQNFDSESARDYALTGALLAGIANKFDAEMKLADKQITELTTVLTQRAQQKVKLDSTARKYSEDKNYLDKLLRTRAAQNEKLRQKQSDIQKNLRELSARAKNLEELASGVSKNKTAGAKYRGRLMRAPVSGRLNTRFGEKTALGLITDGWRITTRSGAVVNAPNDGTVEFADSFKGYNRVIIISHKNGYYTTMAGLESANVLVGQEVLAGEPVGAMPGKTSEMYLELRHGSRATDPAQMFDEP
ncbi:MAG: peptidoglycan DD-metalloendopeptidase family protein [Rickettsiales bacterium]|jgi:septal ring factor EnvC (AmiA/AmiB activator)|nr:peptidoglycan DD-metalloendopeptidase family protein [Rickettsiales bacterium]